MWANREVGTELFAYVVGRYFELYPSNPAFYVVAWQEEGSNAIQDRLDRISSVSKEFISDIERRADSS